MKTYSVTHNPSNKEKSKHNLPDEMLIKLPNIQISRIDKSTYRWADPDYGFIITDEELDKYKPLYRHKGGNTYDEVYIVDVSNLSDYDRNAHKYRLSSDNWTFVYRTKVNNPSYSRTQAKVTFLQMYRTELTKSPQKLFDSVSEMFDHYKKENEKRNAKILAQRELFAATNNGPLQLETPKRKIVKINKATEHVSGAKVGDTIYGVIKVLDQNGRNVLWTQSTYVSYVEVYLNDKKVNTLPMSTFGNVMEKNFVLE